MAPLISGKNRPYSSYKEPRRKAKPDYSNRCAICNSLSTPTNKLFIDHIIEIRRGGKDIKENVWWLCKSCHYNKTRLNSSIIENSERHLHLQPHMQDQKKRKLTEYNSIKAEKIRLKELLTPLSVYKRALTNDHHQTHT